ncbi:MAG: efflux RND transporter periplasmic adaptor subunit, partial [Pseudomonadota bacterium]
MDQQAMKSTWKGWALAGLFTVAVISATAAAVMALHARASTDPTLPIRPALTVLAEPVQLMDHYVEKESFVGRVEPARETRPAAERAGLLVDVLVEEGDQVSQGQVLARLDIRSLQITRDRLVAERASIDADIELARRTTDRSARLVGEGWSSKQTYDEARYSVSSLTARRDAVDAQIDQVKLDLEKSVITAPFAGRIAARMTDEGTVIAAGTALMRLQETDRPQARIGVPSDRVSSLSLGDRLVLDYQGQPVSGHVAAVTPDLEMGTRTIPVLIDITSDGPLAMGQLIRMSLDRRIDVRGAWVDVAALQEAERGLWSLFTVVETEGQHTVQREAVEV